MLIVVYLVVMALLTAYALVPGLPTRRRRWSWLADAEPAPADGDRPAVVRADWGLPAWQHELITPLPAPPVPTESENESAEAFLAARLLAGELSADGYRHAMALLAARDAVSHPLVVPPERSG